MKVWAIAIIGAGVAAAAGAAALAFGGEAPKKSHVAKPGPRPSKPNQAHWNAEQEDAAPLEALCKESPAAREAAAKAWAARSVQAMRKASQSSIEAKKNRFPCNDPERLSWVVDNALAGWLGSGYRASANNHVSMHGGGTRRPWNALRSDQLSVTAEPEPGPGTQPRRVWSALEQQQNLTPCALYVARLLTHYATAECPGVATRPHPGPYGGG